MPPELLREPLFLLVVSALILASLLIKAGAKRVLHFPPVVGYIALGGVMRAIHGQIPFMTQEGEEGPPE